jgi:type II secretory pathway pseudopilin PulG
MSIKNQKGQSLMEILIGLGIISILMGSVTYSLVAVLKTSTVTEQTQTAGLVGNSLMDSAITLAEGNWNSVYNLTKGSANHYFIVNSPTTTPSVAPGDESVLSDNIINGLVGHWKFDEKSGSTAYDSSGNGNIGILYNSPTRTASTSCKVGSCMSFDGVNDYVQVPTSASLNPTTVLTMEVWIKSTGNAESDGRIISKRAGVVGYEMLLMTASGLIEVFIGTPNGYVSVDSNTKVNDGNWHHIVVTRNEADIRIYVDGVLDRTASSYTGSVENTSNLFLGRYSPTAIRFFNGSIDDVRIYNRALSASEISQIYNSYVYNRYFYVDNVNRTACGTGNITTNSANVCTGSANDVVEDPSTQKITVGTYWNIKGVTNNFENFEYVTRWINSYAQQKSWGGSAGVAGAVTDFGSNFYTYSNVATTTSGSLRINGL